MPLVIDWPVLRERAIHVAACAHAPYSKFPVGAAGLADDGGVVTGCNVENASYGLTLCAECGVVSDLFRSGCTQLLAISIVDGAGDFLWPCGRCRQLLFEVGGVDLLIDSAEGPRRLGELLPHPFGADDLPKPGQGSP